MAAIAGWLVAPASLDAARKSRAEDVPPPAPEVYLPTDPYLTFLDELGEKSPTCKSHTDAIKEQLSALEGVVSKYQSASPEERERLIAELRELTPALAAAENDLTACFEMVPASQDGAVTWSATEIPATAISEPEATTPAPAESDDTTNEESATAAIAAATAPEPPAELPAVPPAPSRERAYVELLQNVAGNSAYGVEFASDVKKLLGERRQLALRYLEASTEDRPHLGFVIAIVSRRLHSSADGIIDPTVLARN